MKPGVIIVGSANMDLVVNVDRHPGIGETILGGKFATIPGGKGANQAVAAARMGAAVTLIGRVGDDGFGKVLRTSAAGDGINTEYLLTDDREATGVALITVDAEGRNTIVVASGANHSLTTGDLQAARRAFEKATVLVTQLESPLETVRTALILAKENGLKVVLNPAPAQVLSDGILTMVDYLIPNEHEVLLLSGEKSLEPAIKKLQAAGVPNLIITLGEKGVLVVSSGGRKHFPAYTVKAVDTVAAGDAFVGAFATGLAEGMDIEQAVQLGNAAAAISVTRYRAQHSIPQRAEVQAFLLAQK